MRWRKATTRAVASVTVQVFNILRKAWYDRRGYPREDRHGHDDLAGEEETVSERLLIGPRPEDRREDQALGCPRAFFAKRQIREPRRFQKPIENVLKRDVT